MYNYHFHVGHSKILLPEKWEDWGCYLLLPPFQQKESENSVNLVSCIHIR